MSSYYTSNSAYGSFYSEQKKRIEEDRNKEISKRETSNNFNSYQNKQYQYSNNYNYQIPKKKESLTENISYSLNGLNNLGNTCYINTCLQNLIHCEPFITKFLKEINKINSNQNSRTYPISNSFYELLLQMCEINKDYINPSNFVNTFINIHDNFKRYQENDTQEFCRYLLQDFNYELNTVESPSNYKKELPKTKDKNEMFNNYKKDCLSKENSIITDLFIGYFSFEYACDCGFREYSFSQFLDLPVQMESNAYGYDLYQMLKNNFYKKSYVDMGENCSFCGRTSKKNEIMKIAYLPDILIISLQRINNKYGTKNESFVKFYEGLDLKEIIDTEITNRGDTKYDLFAISNHIGQINSGHYFSHIKIGNEWYCFEDSKVYKIGTQIDMNTKEVYTLFFKRHNLKY